MAKESIKARERKREKMVAAYAEKRAALKAAGDYVGLQKLPRNASPVRLRILSSPTCVGLRYGLTRLSLEVFLGSMIRKNWRPRRVVPP